MTNALPTLLIIDASPQSQARYRDFLQDEYHIVEAHSGADGAALNRQLNPACILFDCTLPDVDGIALLATLLANTTPACAVIVATDLDHTATAVQMLKSGAYEYLLKKDLDASMLRHALRNALNDVALKRQLQEHRAALVARNRELERELAARMEKKPT